MSDVVSMRATALNFSGKQLDLIKHTVASDCDADEFSLFIEVARRVNLDPFRKQIYAVVYSKKDPAKRKMSIITAIDGYRAIAARNKDYRPTEDDAQIVYDPELKGENNPAGIVSATVRCWKLGSDNKWYPVAGTAHWEEYVPIKDEWAYDPSAGKRQPTGNQALDKSSNWYKMPRVMISKVAEALALRRGWPEDLSGLYTDDEMARATVDMTASEALEDFERDKRLTLTKSKDAVFVQWNPMDPLEAVPIGQFADRVAAFASQCKNLPDLMGWEDTNRVALQDFWAKAKPDALELKKLLERRRADIIETSKA